MSPIDFPDLLEQRGTKDERGRRKSEASSSGRLVSATLRSRSRSRTQARAQRRSASCQPAERTSKEEKLAMEKKKRRSLSKPPKESRKEDRVVIKARKEKKVEIVDLTTKERTRKARTPSPTKRRSTLKTSNSNPEKSAKKKEWGADIINLVDRDEEELLTEIMSGNNPVINPTAKKSSEKKSSSDKVSKQRKATSSSPTLTKKKEVNASPSKKDKYSASSSNLASGSPKSVVRFPDNKAAYSDDELSDSDDDSDDEEDETNSVATNDLLDQVKSRMEQQRLLEEAKELRSVIGKKDTEIEQLTGQLRMAISTKCDLVIAHTELERLHEMDLKARDQYADAMKRANLALQELRAEVEKEFMNELTDLSKQVQEADARRAEDVAEKDEIIRLLQEKVRRLELTAMGGQSARHGRDNDKVKYYKQKLGVYDQ